MNENQKGVGQWLKEICDQGHLSLRDAAELTGLSHSTIQTIIKTGHASAETVRRLANAFGGDGHEKLALEDVLLVLAGYRTQRGEKDEVSQPMARLLDKLSQLNEPQLKLVGHFADFLCEMETD